MTSHHEKLPVEYKVVTHIEEEVQLNVLKAKTLLTILRTEREKKINEKNNPNVKTLPPQEPKGRKRKPK